MRRLLKFLHVIGAIGMMGSMASLLVLMSFTPPPNALAGYALLRSAMAAIATWVLLPSLVLTLIAGMLAIAFNRGYQNAGWAWAKLATGVLIFEGALVNLLGPIKDDAARSADLVKLQSDPSALTASFGAERGTLWVLLAITLVNVVLGIWRPRLTSIPD